MQLIRLLGKDALQSSEALAKQLNVSSVTIRRRLRKLLQNELLRIVGVVDASKVGLRLAVLIAFNTAPEKIESITEMLANRPEITWVSTTTGRFHIMALARFGSTEELSQFVHGELAHVEGLRQSETFICFEVKKCQYIQLGLSA